MARLTYYVNGKIEASRAMRVPTKMYDIVYWFVEARKAYPKIPDPTSITSDWFLSHVVATIDQIHFVMHDTAHSRSTARIIIERNTDIIAR